MDKQKLKDVLDTIYELEGLVYLAINRDDSHGDIERLISAKSRNLVTMCERLSQGESELGKDNTLPKADIEMFYTGDGPMSESEIIHTIKEDNEDFTKVPEDLSIKSSDTELSHPSLEKEQEYADSIEIEDGKDDVMPEFNEAPRGRLVFSINDKFRFKRELFANSDASFNNSLALVASMENYEEAEDYFINELLMDPTRPVVTDFFEIIRKYFNP